MYFNSSFNNKTLDEYKKKLDSIDLNLADLEIIACIIIIIGSLILILSAKLNKKEIYDKTYGKNNIKASQVTYMAFLVEFIGIFLFLYVSLSRKNQIICKKNLGITKESILPYDLISSGYSINLFSNLVKIMGAYNMNNLNFNNKSPV
ncbi:MAG: hypothetical protein RSB70_00230 [Clostridium sp.]